MSVDLNEKLKLVNEWLSFDVIQGDVPAFEKNETTINLLYQLALYNMKQSLINTTLRNNYKQKIIEYRSESKRIEEILKMSHLYYRKPNQSMDTSSSVKHSDAETTLKDNEHVRSLSELASILKLKNTTQSCFMDALYNLSNEHDKVSNESTDLKKTISDISDKTVQLMTKLQYLNDIHQQFELEIQQREQDKELQSRMNAIEYLQRKSKEYEMEVTRLKKELAENLSTTNVDVQQSSIIGLYKAFLDLKKEIAPKLETIEKFHGLPPDVQMIKAKINECKEELKQLEEIFHRKAQHIWFD